MFIVAEDKSGRNRLQPKARRIIASKPCLFSRRLQYSSGRPKCSPSTDISCLFDILRERFYEAKIRIQKRGKSEWVRSLACRILVVAVLSI
jgi:hypothetical protein